MSVKRTTKPTDRLTRLCDAMTDHLDKHAEHGDEKCVIFMSSESDKMMGLVMHGYEDDMEAVAEVFMHLEAIFEANGKKLIVKAAD